MSLTVSKKKIEEPTSPNKPTHSSPAVITRMAVEFMDPFKLRKLNPYDFSKKELVLLRNRFFMELDTYGIYFFSEAIDEKYGYP